MMQKPKSPEDFIRQNSHWQGELEHLREIILQIDLEEDIKWMFPTYMDKGKNILSIMAAKEYYGLWFFQGGTLTDDHGLLSNAQKGKTKAMRQMRFDKSTGPDAEIIRSYILEAIENERSGNIIKPQKRPLIIPQELKSLFKNEKIYHQAFEQLNLTKKREFCEHILSAKRDATKQIRLAKIKPMILQGIGLGDKYRK